MNIAKLAQTIKRYIYISVCVRACVCVCDSVCMCVFQAVQYAMDIFIKNQITEGFEGVRKDFM